MATLYAKREGAGWALYKTRECRGRPFATCSDDPPLLDSIHLNLAKRANSVDVVRFTVEKLDD